MATTATISSEECPIDLPEALESTGRYVFKDFHNLDVVFDAGGKVSLSLTTVTVTSQMLWPADFLQSPTIASKVGIGGSLWYTMAIVLSVLAFAALCVKLKTRAPGAKTFPQIAYARFGRWTHIMFCCVALFTNLVIIANLILAGKASIEVLTKDSSNEFICLLLAVLFGSYCLVGGLGTTFYISYFNTSIIFISTSIFILKITYFAEPEVANITSAESLHAAMSCLQGPKGNAQDSFLTFRSESGIIFGVVTLFMTIAIIFCDQANWQSRIAAKPSEGMVGFLFAAFLWFAIPTSVSFVTSMTYKTMSLRNGTNLLANEDIDQGYISPLVIQTLLGSEGCYLLLTLITMTLMSTGSGEIMAISSIIVYDIFKAHVTPFRKNLNPTDCPLCSHSKLVSAFDGCQCPPALDCNECGEDVKRAFVGGQEPDFRYKCSIHGKYRHYEQQLLRYKSWAMIWVIAAIVPFGLAIIESGMNLNWAFMAAQVFIAPFLVPLYLTIAWARATDTGLVTGSLAGLVCSVSGMLTYASTYPGGLGDFFTNTAQDYSILTGLLAGFTVSTLVSISISLWTSRNRKTNIKRELNGRIAKDEGGRSATEESTVGSYDQIVDGHLEIEWEKTMSIDNPLNPYKLLYRKELTSIDAWKKPLTTKHMEIIFRRAKLYSGIMAAISFTVFLVVIPALALSQEVLTATQLGAWISVCQHWCLIATVFVVLVPPIQEGIQIWRQKQENKDNSVTTVVTKPDENGTATEQF
ncbi:DUR3-like protein [Mya arenaria]|uniref:DUR3-like protein n=1 Tax=Mya arenaria TaxID=6604 RepID=A0ABY7DKK2_MYAAR|nr:DUR3-like protein [Mya arenaria]